MPHPTGCWPSSPCMPPKPPPIPSNVGSRLTRQDIEYGHNGTTPPRIRPDLPPRRPAVLSIPSPHQQISNSRSSLSRDSPTAVSSPSYEHLLAELKQVQTRRKNSVCSSDERTSNGTSISGETLSSVSGSEEDVWKIRAGKKGQKKVRFDERPPSVEPPPRSVPSPLPPPMITSSQPSTPERKTPIILATFNYPFTKLEKYPPREGMPREMEDDSFKDSPTETDPPESVMSSSIGSELDRIGGADSDLADPLDAFTELTNLLEESIREMASIDHNRANFRQQRIATKPDKSAATSENSENIVIENQKMQVKYFEYPTCDGIPTLQRVADSESFENSLRNVRGSSLPKVRSKEVSQSNGQEQLYAVPRLKVEQVPVENIQCQVRQNSNANLKACRSLNSSFDKPNTVHLPESRITENHNPESWIPETRVPESRIIENQIPENWIPESRIPDISGVLPTQFSNSYCLNRIPDSSEKSAEENIRSRNPENPKSYCRNRIPSGDTLPAENTVAFYRSRIHESDKRAVPEMQKKFISDSAATTRRPPPQASSSFETFKQKPPHSVTSADLSSPVKFETPYFGYSENKNHLMANPVQKHNIGGSTVVETSSESSRTKVQDIKILQPLKNGQNAKSAPSTSSLSSNSLSTPPLSPKSLSSFGSSMDLKASMGENMRKLWKFSYPGKGECQEDERSSAADSQESSDPIQNMARQARLKNLELSGLNYEPVEFHSLSSPIYGNHRFPNTTSNTQRTPVRRTGSFNESPMTETEFDTNGYWRKPLRRGGSFRNGGGRPNKPPSFEASQDWYWSEELPRGSGCDPATGTLAPWFHGAISRQTAEKRLENQTPGTFLLRLTDRVWGYALSVRSSALPQGGSGVAHFLIEALPDPVHVRRYRMMGAGEEPFSSLNELVFFYTKHSLTSCELLTQVCPREMVLASGSSWQRRS